MYLGFNVPVHAKTKKWQNFPPASILVFVPKNKMSLYDYNPSQLLRIYNVILVLSSQKNQKLFKIRPWKKWDKKKLDK